MIINRNIMKKYIHILGAVLASVCLASCATPSQKMTVVGTPGTVIYSPWYVELGTIGSDGKANIKISYSSYKPFLFSRRPGVEELVPFALDYKYKSGRGKRIELTVGLMTSVALIGIPLACDGWRWLDVEDYRYLKNQTTNDAFRFLPIVDNGVRKEVGIPEATLMPESIVTPEEEGQASSSVARSRSSKSLRTLKDYGKQVEGSYTCSGRLKQRGSVVESYSDVKIVITRIDKNNVYVDVKEGGESFFSSKGKYAIKKDVKGGFVLTLSGISTAVIKIDVEGRITYVHPKVNIDGDMYTLEANGNKLK